MKKTLAQPPIHYAITAPQPNSHLYHVTLTIARPQANQMLMLPVWIPGSYLIREFAKHLQCLHVRQGKRTCTYAQLDKHRWQLHCQADKPVQISYQVYARDNSVRSAWLDSERGFFNATSLCLMAQGLTHKPHHIHISPACKNWHLATGLQALDVDKNGFGTYLAPDYDTLADCPVEMGNFWSGTFTACGVPHRFVIATPPPAFDAQRLLADTRRICQAAMRLWHGNKPQKHIPFKHYIFMLNAVGDGYGGLEHSNSTALIASRKCLPQTNQPTGSDYTTLLGLISHEYFHAWNIKRLKPACFSPYNYAKENYTTLLWFFEGFTSYYDDLLLLRAGCIDLEGYIGQLQKALDSVQNNPGRHIQSAALSSLEAWTKLYRPDENSPNATTNYYTKGALIALCLDLTLRREGHTTLDAVMQTLYQHCFASQKTPFGMTEADLAAVLHALGGRSFANELRQWVHGTEELPLEQLLAHTPIRIRKTPAPLAQQWGLRCKEGASISIQTVLRGSAAEAAGMAAGDEWLGIELPAAAATSSSGADCASHQHNTAWRVGSLAEVQSYLPNSGTNTSTNKGKNKTKGKNQTPAFTAIIARDERLLRLPMHLPASPLQSLKLVAAPASEPSANNTMAQQPWPWC